MAYRYTNTDKWSDAWFTKLKPLEKLLFNYLCDNCDIAGFIELNEKRWTSDIGTDLKSTEGALKGLQRGLIYSATEDCIYLRTFLKHQKNLPLNPEKNMAHRGILKRFELYSFKFSIENIYEFIEGACKGLQSPYGNGIGNGIGNGKLKGDVYKNLLLKVLDENKISLPDGFESLILEWLKYKSEKGQSYKETGLKTLIKTFLKDSDSDKITGREMLDYSMSKNYTGLFKNNSTKKEYHATDFPNN